MGTVFSRICEKGRKKKTGNLQSKLTMPVLLAVAAIFLLVLLVGIIYYNSAYRDMEISDCQKQLDKAAYSVSKMQNSVENVAKQVAVSDAVQDGIQNSVRTSADYFVKANNIQKTLGTYTFIMDYIQEVLIYTKEGDTYTSLLFRGKFDPNQELWYQNFKATGVNKGYTEVYSATVAQDGRKQQVISYVLTYYSILNYNNELGDIIISVDYASIEKMAELDNDLLKGYAIYDMSGTEILKKGNVENTYDNISETEKTRSEDEDGNIYLISRELESGWIMVAEISGEALQSRLLFVEILIVALFLILAFLIVSALTYNIKKVVKPINRLSQAAEQLGEGNFDVSVDVTTGDEVEILANTFNKMVKDVRHYTELSVEHEKIIRKSQVDQLLLQINPHFIYNTLNSIVYMARINGNKDIEEFVNAFISLLQSTLRVENKVYTTLGEELKNVENYLILQKYRYMDKFEAKIDCPQELQTYLVPKVILQPIVENAIFHGIAPMEGKGKLDVSVKILHNKLRIIIEDNGIGMSKELAEKMFDEKYVSGGSMRKIGIANVYRRIKEICGEEYGFCIESELGKGTKVVIDLPLKEK